MVKVVIKNYIRVVMPFTAPFSVCIIVYIKYTYIY